MSVKMVVVLIVSLILLVCVGVHAVTVKNAGKEVMRKYHDRQAGTIVYVFDKK